MRRVVRSWGWRVAVEGHSMEPTLRAGDWLLVDPDGFARRRPAIGDLVVATDPRRPDRWVVKRIAGALPDGGLGLAGDHPGHAEEPTLASVSLERLVGRPWFRYWPPQRLGRVR